MQALRRASMSDLMSVRGIGAKKAQMVLDICAHDVPTQATSTAAASATSGTDARGQRESQPTRKRKPGGGAAGAKRAAKSSTSSQAIDKKALASSQAELANARDAYYKGSPTMTDDVYDALLTHFRTHVSQAINRGIDVSDADAFLASVGAPPSGVPPQQRAAPPPAKSPAPPKKKRTRKKSAGKITDEKERQAIQQVEHTAERGGRLLSLAAVHSEADLRTWWRRHVTDVLGDEGGASVVVEPKVDGLTLRLSYEGGKLIEVRADPLASEQDYLRDVDRHGVALLDISEVRTKLG